MRELQGGGIICQDVTETCQDSNKACQDVIKICQEGSRTYKTAVLCHDAKPVKTVARVLQEHWSKTYETAGRQVKTDDTKMEVVLIVEGPEIC